MKRIKMEFEFFEMSERRPVGVQALLVRVDEWVYPAAYSDLRGFVWEDGDSIDEGSIKAWAIFPLSSVEWEAECN